MANNINLLVMSGNLTGDPKISYLPSQTAVIEFGLASNRRYKSQDGAEKQETCYMDCKAFGKTAELIGKHFVKGKPIMVEGRLITDKWQAQDGSQRSKTRLVVQNFYFMDSGQQVGQQQPPGNNGGIGDSIPF